MQWGKPLRKSRQGSQRDGSEACGIGLSFVLYITGKTITLPNMSPRFINKIYLPVLKYFGR